MNKYILILGRHPRLSLAELKKVAPDFKIIEQNKNILIGRGELEAEKLLDQLGGTIKIAEFKKEIDNIHSLALANWLKLEDKEKKIIFGFSVYGRKKFPRELKKIGIDYKKELQNLGYKARYVESKEPILSSVIVQKEKCQEIILIYRGEKILVGQTLAVQKFADYSKRDYGRPARDAYSGMLPPKLAKIMINLAQAKKNDLILDPFCGSGTILQELLLLGYQNIIGSDISQKAIEDSRQNIDWLKNKKILGITSNNLNLIKVDAGKISQVLKRKVDRIITEVYLGPVKGEVQIKKTKKELRRLYIEIFKEFKKILNPGAKLVIAFPAWKIGQKVAALELAEEFKKIGYTVNQDTYLYGRPEAQILREIYLLGYEQKRSEN